MVYCVDFVDPTGKIGWDTETGKIESPLTQDSTASLSSPPPCAGSGRKNCPVGPPAYYVPWSWAIARALVAPLGFGMVMLDMVVVALVVDVTFAHRGHVPGEAESPLVVSWDRVRETHLPFSGPSTRAGNWKTNNSHNVRPCHSPGCEDQGAVG